ncbi:uncharacterized protein G2W53_002630 [Senna tora]|uniref:Uncharacterized protein n=1 Tax=Senna tora TaxID=362788 RepID=A0A835CIF9_9FABA|nr:uncharacterized protein G2W53_002630 [Senna tora]
MGNGQWGRKKPKKKKKVKAKTLSPSQQLNAGGNRRRNSSASEERKQKAKLFIQVTLFPPPQLRSAATAREGSHRAIHRNNRRCTRRKVPKLPSLLRVLPPPLGLTEEGLVATCHPYFSIIRHF